MAREIYFLIQNISTATVRNENFAGESETTIYGKGDYTLFRETPDGMTNCNLLAPYWVREYGYKRECDAKRNWAYKNPAIDEPYWKAEVKIVRAWVRKDNRVFIEV